MTTVRQLEEQLKNIKDKDLEIVIYPKYSSDKVDGYKKHEFYEENVCLQEPYALSIKDDKKKLKEYFGGREEYKRHEVNKHVAIIF